MLLLAGFALTAWLFANTSVAFADERPATVDTSQTDSVPIGHGNDRRAVVVDGPARSHQPPATALLAAPGRAPGIAPVLRAAHTARDAATPLAVAVDHVACRTHEWRTGEGAPARPASPTIDPAVTHAPAVDGSTVATTDVGRVPSTATIPGRRLARLLWRVSVMPLNRTLTTVDGPLTGTIAPVTVPLRSIIESLHSGRLGLGQLGNPPHSGPASPVPAPLVPAASETTWRHAVSPVAPTQPSTRSGPTGVDAARLGLSRIVYRPHQTYPRAVRHPAEAASSPVPLIPAPPVPGTSLPDSGSRAQTTSSAASIAAPPSSPFTWPTAPSFRVPAMPFPYGVCQRAEDPSFSPD